MGGETEETKPGGWLTGDLELLCKWLGWRVCGLGRRAMGARWTASISQAGQSSLEVSGRQSHASRIAAGCSWGPICGHSAGCQGAAVDGGWQQGWG
jgi:hypothetical protein